MRSSSSSTSSSSTIRFPSLNGGIYDVGAEGGSNNALTKAVKTGADSLDRYPLPVTDDNAAKPNQLPPEFML